MGCSRSSSKREVYSNTTLPQETRKTLHGQLNFTPKTTGKRKERKTEELVEERTYKDPSRNKWEINE